MNRPLLILGIFMVVWIPSRAQMLGVSFELDTVFGPASADFDPNGDLEGYTSTLVYANFTNPTDVLSAIYADTAFYSESAPLQINSTCDCWNPDLGSMVIGSAVNPAFENVPGLAPFIYDTFWTIGKKYHTDPGAVVYWQSNPPIDGSQICGELIYNGLMHIFGTTGDWPVNAVAGDDLKILIARVTTCGPFSLTLNAQVFVEGQQDQVEQFQMCDYADVDYDGICDDIDDCIGTYDACGVCNGPGAVYECGCQDISEGDCDCEGTPIDALGICGGGCLADLDADGICDDIDDCVGTYDACGVCNGPGAVYECGCQTIPEGDCDCEGNQLDVIGVCGGNCMADADDDGICDDIDPCVGVLDAIGVCNGDCELDANSNGVCDDSEILGCTNASACNFDPTATLDDCTCQLPLVAGDCLAGGAACGPGTYWHVESQTCLITNPADLNFDGCVQLSDLLTFLVAYGGCDVQDTPFQCGDPVSYQGYDYATVQIGDQCWFAENLRSENYENGDAIPSNLSDSEWNSTTSGAVAVYGEGSSTCYNYSPDGDACDEAWSLNEYGRLYNWYAVDDARGFCPSGWHVPTDGEWMTMEMALEMSEAEANGTGWRGTDQGTQMKTDYGWYYGGNGTNSSGFSGLPGGLRGGNGYFLDAVPSGYWWSSSPSGSSAWYRYLGSYGENVYRSSSNLRNGFSVRCIKDTE